MARMPPGGCGGGGYLKVQRHLRTAVISAGFALVTITPFTADLTVPSIAQSQLTGYKYPARTVRQTEPQQGWLYTASIPFDPTVTVAPIEQSQLTGYTYPARQVRQTHPQDGWLYTGSLPFDPTVTVAPIEQSQMDGYRSAARTVRQIELQWVLGLEGLYRPAVSIDSQRPSRPRRVITDQPSNGWLTTAIPFAGVDIDSQRPSHLSRMPVDQPPDGWLYTASAPAFDPAQYQPPWSDRTPASASSRYRYDGYPQTDWIYQNLPVADVWTEAKFQNIAGDLTPTRSALKFRYPLASSGFSTDGSTPDVWDATKFQNVSGDRTAERRQYDPRFEYHKFAFGLLDARVVMPAIDQLRNSERAAQRKGRPIVTPDSLGWLYENLPIAFDPQYLVHSEDGRLRERYKKVPQLDQPSQAWIYTAVPAFDPQYLVHSIDDRMREQYKKVPQLDQPSQAWIYNSVPAFDPQYLIQTSAPQRMANRAVLSLQRQCFYNDLSWLDATLGLTEVTPQPAVVIVGGGDDAPRKHKKKTQQELFREIEQTIRQLLAGEPAPLPTELAPYIPSHATTVARIEIALSRLSTLRVEQRQYEARIHHLRQELEQYQARLLDDDEADWLLFL